MHEPTNRPLPWDVMGKGMSTEYADVATALAENNLDFEVEMAPVFAETRSGDGDEWSSRSLAAPQHRAVVRPDGNGGQFVIGVTGKRFTPITNADAFAVADEIVAEGGATITGAADYRHGGASLLVVTLPEAVKVKTPKGNDVTAMNVIIKNAHDGSAALTFALTGMRLMCTNAVQAAIRDAGRVWKVNHTPRAQERVELAHKAILRAMNYTQALQGQAQAMMDQKIVDAEFEAIISRLWPVTDTSERTANNRQAIHEEVRALYHGADTLEGVRGTRWGAYNAIVEWVDWGRPVRGNNPVMRAQGSLEGAAVRLKERAWDLAGV